MKIKTSYPEQWARGIVEEFVEKYPRGCVFFRKALRIKDEKFNGLLVKSLRSDQFWWRLLKKSIKRLETMPTLTTRTAILVEMKEILLNGCEGTWTPVELESINFIISSQTRDLQMEIIRVN